MDHGANWLGIAYVLSIFLAGSGSLTAKEQGRVLFDFSKPEAAVDWQPVNDGVMGGVSEGRLRRTDEGSMEFFGTLSLENNGGFASVQSRARNLGLSAGDSIMMRLRGDGRSYFLNLRIPTRRIAFSYRAAFQTKAGEWQEIRLPLEAFEASSFGTAMKDAAPVDPKEVNSLSFLLADSKAGPFKLEVDWIKAIRQSAE